MVPVSTEYFCSSIGFPSLLIIGFPSGSNFFTQFFKSIPIPPVTPTVVKNIGEIPLVPATIGEFFTNLPDINEEIKVVTYFAGF